MTEKTFRRFKAIGPSGRNRLEEHEHGNFMLLADHLAIIDEERRETRAARRSANLAKNAMDEMQAQHEMTQRALQEKIEELTERLAGRRAPDDYAVLRTGAAALGLYPTVELAEAAVLMDAHRSGRNPMLYQIQPRWK